MKDEEFWDRVRRGAEKLDIPEGTVTVWKHRGRVSRDRAISLYQVLAGTEYEIPLERLNQ